MFKQKSVQLNKEPKNRQERVQEILKMGVQLNTNKGTLVFLLAMQTDREVKKFYIEFKEKFDKPKKNS